MKTIRPLRRAAALALLLPVFAGCATQQQLKEYQDEIARLREREAKLQRDNSRLASELDALNADLLDASHRLSEALSGPQYSALTDMGIGVNVRGNDLVISVPSSITFASGKAELTAPGQNAVRAVANVLRSDYPNSEFWIEGHTDSQQPSRSGFDSNRELSIARAMSVLTFLVDSCGVPDSNCVLVGHGEYTPVASNDSADGMSQNRRVEIVVHQPQG
ncbi:OmpA family protein [Engelhardtia mirabilis]|uniref:Putative lipoprotein YiaD n=1 Tax=Engelhardtia mirabilis TaxID=2528011 RepID=A0A518BP77_9BACT|nr:putative lipoprotein YiaD precursor [Planctomycetes bacterium Pla133]QDV03108.1 putative lipoprotein YiaD precursor [Planctomycetes bacterium Pla86]